MIQAEGANMSASASAEANAVKISGNSLEVNIGGGKTSFPNNILRAINPVWYETREAKAREIKAKSLEKTIGALMEGYPVMTRQRATMEAMGYRVTNEQADNFTAVANRASAILEETGGGANPILPETRDYIVDGASHAYEDEVRELWGRILAGEVNKPGSFSKRTLSIVSDMGKADAESFMKLCSYSTGLVASACGKHVIAGALIPILSRDENGASFNGGKVRLKELSTLDALGLIDKSLFNINTIPKGMPFSYLANNVLIIAKNNTEDKKIHFEGAVFQSAGLELSRICNVGSAPDLADILSTIFEKNGLEVTMLPFSTNDIRIP